MSNGLNGGAEEESSLVRLYMELTGASESRARGVFMHICCRDEEEANVSPDCRTFTLPVEEPVQASLARKVAEPRYWLRTTAAIPAHG